MRRSQLESRGFGIHPKEKCLCRLFAPGQARVRDCVLRLAPRANREYHSIRLLDGKTGLPVKASNFLVQVDRHDTAHNEWVHMNDDGTVIVTVPADAKELSVKATYNLSMDTYINCDAAKETDKERDIWYPISDILKSGVVAPNECSKTITPPSPASLCSLCGSGTGGIRPEISLNGDRRPDRTTENIDPWRSNLHPRPFSILLNS